MCEYRILQQRNNTDFIVVYKTLLPLRFISIVSIPSIIAQCTLGNIPLDTVKRAELSLLGLQLYPANWP